MKTLFLIDANSIIHRCFHALPPLTAKDGSPAQALYGLSSVLLKLIRSDHPDYAAALFDRPEPTFREREYADYKATRPPAADELVSQIIAARDLFPKFGIRVFEVPSFEADDLIATFAERFRNTKELQIVILTGDYDTLQLVRGTNTVVRIFRTGISETVTYDDAAVRERYGISPQQLVDYKAFVGDVSDNVKGVSGVGPKTASGLLATHGTIENVYAHAVRDPKLAAKLGSSRAQAELAKRLVTLRRDVPLSVRDLADIRVTTSEHDLRAYFDELGFASLTKRLTASGEPSRAQSVRAAQRSRSSQSPQQNAMF